MSFLLSLFPYGFPLIEAAQTKVIELGIIESLLKVLKSDDIDENEVSMTIAARVTANLCESGMFLHTLTPSFPLAMAFQVYLV